SYPIAVRITDGFGQSAIGSGTLTVNHVAPTLTLSGAAAVAAGDVYILTLSATAPGADVISRRVVDWNDGSAPETFLAKAPVVQHVYAAGAVGGHTIAVQATDEDGTYTASRPLTVNPGPSVSGPAEVPQGATYALTLANPGGAVV